MKLAKSFLKSLKNYGVNSSFDRFRLKLRFFRFYWTKFSRIDSEIAGKIGKRNFLLSDLDKLDDLASNGYELDDSKSLGRHSAEKFSEKFQRDRT